MREAAHFYIIRTLGELHPRRRIEVYRAAPRVLPGFSRRDAAGSEARALFDEALLTAATGAGAAELVGLVTALTGAEGGAGIG